MGFEIDIGLIYNIIKTILFVALFILLAVSMYKQYKKKGFTWVKTHDKRLMGPNKDRKFYTKEDYEREKIINIVIENKIKQFGLDDNPGKIRRINIDELGVSDEDFEKAKQELEERLWTDCSVKRREWQMATARY